MPITLDGTTGATVPAVSDSGNLTFTGTGNRITGDFSTATFLNRVMFQTSTVNGNTAIGAIPNGTSTTSSFIAFNNPDPTNASLLNIQCLSTEARVNTGITGTGTYLPMTFYTNGSEQMRISTAGIVTGTAGNLMLVQGTAVASTSGTSIPFSSIPSWVKRITLMFSGVSTNGANNIIIQIGTGGVATITGYIAQTTGISQSVGASIASTVGFPSYSNAAVYAWSGIVTISNISGNSWVASGVLGNTGTNILSSQVSGVVTLSGALDYLRVISSATGAPSDTFDAGTINIQYE